MRSSRKAVPFASHFEGVQKSVHGKGVEIVQANGEIPKICQSLHRNGEAVLFRVRGISRRYSKAIIALNACNEYFKHQHRLKYRLGYYYEEDMFHLDAVQERMFWIMRQGHRKIRRDIPLFLSDFWED